MVGGGQKSSPARPHLPESRAAAAQLFGEGDEGVLPAGYPEAAGLVINAQLLLRKLEQALEGRVLQEGYGDDEPLVLLADVDGKVTLGHI